MDEVQGMTRDDITRMARDAGFVGFDGENKCLRQFADLVAAHTLSNIDPRRFMSYQEGFVAGAAAEREACAKVAEDFDGPDRYVDDFAAAIRARGETK